MTIMPFTSSRAGSLLLRGLVVSVVAMTAGFAPAKALDLDRKPVLRANVVVHSDLVTVGDFFEGAGIVSQTAIFRAPDLGRSGAVPAAKVVAAAKAAGLFDADAGIVASVNVTHEGREVGMADVQKAITEAVLRQAPIAEGSELQVSFDGAIETRLAEAGSKAPVRLSGLSYSPSNGRFEAIVIFDTGATSDRERIRGTVVEMVRTLTLTHTVNRGDVIAAEDLSLQLQPRRTVTARPIEPSQLIGLAAKRALVPGAPLVLTDFAQPVLVAKGDIITLIYEVPGLTLTGRGQAIDAGVKGETISILNQQSKRIVHGTVISPGRVKVASGYLATASTEIASNIGGPSQ